MSHRPLNNVYHVHFDEDQLPQAGEKKASFAREYAEELTGLNKDQ